MAFVVTIKFPLGRPPYIRTIESAIAARQLFLTTPEDSTITFEGSDQPLSMEELEALAEAEAKQRYGDDHRPPR